MSWRTVVISSNAKLDLRMNYLVVRSDTVHKIHLSEISLLLIESTAVSLTTSLLAELTNRKIKVVFCDEKRNPSSELLPYYGSHDTSNKVRAQIKWTDSIKSEVWTEIVREKIKQQAVLLKATDHNENQLLERYITELVPGDKTNREGHAAKVYFDALFGKTFTRSEDNIINAALNYGYSILLSVFNREVVSNGYITQLGLFHDNMFNQFNLASDMMEPFRPLVDAIVVDASFEKFDHDEKMDMLRVLEKEVFIDGKRQYANNAIKIFSKSIFDALNDNDISLIRFYRNEL